MLIPSGFAETGNVAGQQEIMVEVIEEMQAKGISKPVVVSLAGDVEVEQASEYLFDHGIPAYPYSTEMPVAVPGASGSSRTTGYNPAHAE